MLQECTEYIPGNDAFEKSTAGPASGIQAIDKSSVHRICSGQVSKFSIPEITHYIFFYSGNYDWKCTLNYMPQKMYYVMLNYK